MSHKDQQTDLLLSVGHLFGPLLSFLDDPGAVDEAEQRRIIARFNVDINNFSTEACKLFYDENGRAYGNEYRRMQRHVSRLQRYLVDMKRIRQFREDPNDIAYVKEIQRAIFESISYILGPTKNEICDWHSPCAATRLGTVP